MVESIDSFFKAKRTNVYAALDKECMFVYYKDIERTDVQEGRGHRNE